MWGRDILLMRALALGALVLWTGVAAGKSIAPVDLNRATVSELVSIPGIGQKRAETIVEFRQRRGFRRPADLLRIKGIGRRLYFKIKPYITVEPVPASSG